MRRAVEADLDVLAQFIRELARYERALDLAQATSDQLRTSFFGPTPRVFCDLVETDNGEAAGFAVWFLNYSTWTGTHGIYLEDLFVLPQYRGRGYGKSLLVHLAAECVRQGYARLQWSVLDWNTPSIDFYRSLGAQAQDEWTVYRLSDVALRDVAALASTDGLSLS
ncbi:MAG: GNAT family N-acetyltransferase [Acidobacteriota bacterium]|nr:GNAT family N-acetyltransferase [Acidobacteriota bacterium]